MILFLFFQGPVPGQDRGAAVVGKGGPGAQGHGARTLGGGGRHGARLRRPAGDCPAQVTGRATKTTKTREKKPKKGGGGGTVKEFWWGRGAQ